MAIKATSKSKDVIYADTGSNGTASTNSPENGTQIIAPTIAEGTAREGPNTNSVITANVAVYVGDAHAHIEDDPVTVQGELYVKPTRDKTLVKSILLAVVGLVSLAVILMILFVSGVFKETNTQKTNRNYLLSSLAVHLSGEEPFLDPESPQSRALKWMQNDDQVQIPMSLRDRLIQRYVSALVHFSFENTTYMNASRHECDWNSWGIVYDHCITNPIYSRGMHCRDNSSISDIVYYNFNLSGPIASEIGYLQDLNTLNIGGNPDMRGIIPTEIGKLSQLKNLLIADIGLQGTVPTEIKNLDLEVVLLYFNEDLSGDISPFCTNTLLYYSSDCGNGTSKPVYDCVDFCCRRDMAQCCSPNDPEVCFTTNPPGGDGCL